MKLIELADAVDGRLEGDGEIEIARVAGIQEAGAGDVSFVDNAKYVAFVSQCKASALIVAEGLETSFRPLIRTANPYLAFTRAIDLLGGPRERPEPGIHPSAVIGSGVEIAPDAAVMANVVIEDGVSVESGAALYPGVVVGAGGRIGREAIVYPNVTLQADTVIGPRAIIHSGVTLGAEAPETGALPPPSPRVEIGPDVEIGANGTVVGGIRRTTRIGRGTKLDNLVHVDHDVVIGENTVVVAMVTIEPEATIGNRVTLAGQAGIKRGVSVGDGAIIGARSIVTRDVPGGEVWSGIPAISHDKEKRIKAAMMRLPKLYRRVQEIEDKLSGSAENH